MESEGLKHVSESPPIRQPLVPRHQPTDPPWPARFSPGPWTSLAVGAVLLAGVVAAFAWAVAR